MEAKGDLGLKSNFESVARRIGGIYAPPVTSGDLDGRLFAAAVRHRRIEAAVRAIPRRSAVVLHAYAHHELLGVMLIQATAKMAHRVSRTKRSLPDWMGRIAPRRDKEQSQDNRSTWLRIRADAQRELDRSLADADLRWRRR